MNKAHSAVVNRILARYQGTPANDGLLDIIAGDMLIAVETTKTLATAVAQIHTLGGTRYVAVTNQESLAEALLLTAGTPVGVMNSKGDIVKAADPPPSINGR
jgi:hypothetical protein